MPGIAGSKPRIYCGVDKGRPPAGQTGVESKSALGSAGINKNLTVGPIFGAGNSPTDQWGNPAAYMKPIAFYPLSVVNASNALSFSDPNTPYPGDPTPWLSAFMWIEPAEQFYWVNGVQLPVDTGFSTLIQSAPTDAPNGIYVNPPNVSRNGGGLVLKNYPGIPAGTGGSCGMLTPYALSILQAHILADGGFGCLLEWVLEQGAGTGLMSFPYDGGFSVADTGPDGAGGETVTWNPPVTPPTSAYPFGVGPTNRVVFAAENLI